MSADQKPRRPKGPSATGRPAQRGSDRHATDRQGSERQTAGRSKPARDSATGAAPSQLQKPWLAKKPPATVAPQGKVAPALLKQHKLEESKVQGENACRVCFRQRPDAVVKMYLEAAMASKFADVMKYLAANKKAYHLVDAAELEKISGSQHHGGVVLIVKRKPEQSLAAYLAAAKHKKQDCLLALDGVGNPHNLGAIVRSCAHFGVQGIIMTQPDLLQSGAASRTAEGGVEFVDGLACDNLPLALQLCKAAGYSLITTSSHAGVSLYQSQLGRKVVVVFGEEMDGVSKQVANSTDVALQIPGSGRVESLNVSVAASLILGEWFRQQQ